MAHPVSVLNSLSRLESLVISSGWMLSKGLGLAIASLCPTIVDHSSKFNLTISGWRIKTHYDPNIHRKGAWEPQDHDDYQYTVHSPQEFFFSINPNSISSLDLDFKIRYSQQQPGDRLEVGLVQGL